MDYIPRLLEKNLQKILARGKSFLLLGARQTGKSTLIKRLDSALTVSFTDPRVRLHYERSLSTLTGEIESLAETHKNPLVIIDEVQKIPEILDVVQDLIDRRVAQFVLTGSSARKLRHGSKVNLLPGRVVVCHLDPLSLSELSVIKEPNLKDLLLYGSLPGVVTVKDNHEKEEDLISYVTTYLEEEVRAEALVRNVGSFARFLKLAASESGNLINFRKLSQEIGVAHTTLAEYYQILEDCLIAERIDPLTKTKMRRRLTKSPKYIFFDLGVRRLSADEGAKLPEKFLGALFEQWVGLELIRMSRLAATRTKIYFWRDTAGPEVDWVIEREGAYIPIEVKWTEHPHRDDDIKHLELFKTEYSNTEQAYLVCRVPRKIKLSEGVYALPWQQLDELV